MTSERDRSPDRPNAPARAGDVWNRDEALAALGGNEALLREAAQLLEEEATSLLAALDDAAARDDAEALEHSAHRLKGAIAIFAAAPAVEAASAVERIGREQRIPEASAALAALRERVAELLSALRLVR